MPKVSAEEIHAALAPFAGASLKEMAGFLDCQEQGNRRGLHGGGDQEAQRLAHRASEKEIPIMEKNFVMSADAVWIKSRRSGQ